MKPKNLCSYLKMDSYDVIIPFSKSKNEIAAFLKEKSIQFDSPSDEKIILKSKILLLDIEFFIFFKFECQKLTSISMAPGLILEGKALYSQYSKVQKSLVKELGYPHNVLMSIMNFLVPDSRTAQWRCNGGKIEHYLLDRFRVEEIISIKL